MKDCAKRDDLVVCKAIEQLPQVQQMLVMQCLNVAKTGGNKRNRRYTPDWVYECLLMRIKSPALYEHLRRKDILPLPTQNTLLKYIRSFDVGFGFKKQLFETLRMKGASLSPQQRRGNISTNR